MNLSVLTRRLMAVVTSGASIACTVALVAPASFAQQASLSGAGTIASPLGFVNSLSIETVLPNGAQFDGPYTITPTYDTTTSANGTILFTDLTVEATAITAPSPNLNFEAAAAAALNDAVTAGDWEVVGGVIESGAGIDGF